MSTETLELEAFENDLEPTFLETYTRPTISDFDERLAVVREAGVPAVPIETLGYNISPLVWMENARGDAAPGNSFKARGAYYAMKKAVARGVRKFLTASAGNHAQGAANAANKLGVAVNINMPANTPEVKVQGVQNVSGDAPVHIKYFDTFEDAQADAENPPEGTENLSAFNNYDVISGQGTLIYEMLLQKPDTDVVYLTVGGGGLLASALEVVDTMKNAGLVKPTLKVVAVMLEGNDSLLQTLGQKNDWRPKQATGVDTFAEGGSVQRIGDIPAALIDLYKEHLETEVVTKNDMARALWYVEQANLHKSDDEKMPIDETTSLVTRAGALVRAERRNLEGGKGKENWITVTTGNNADPEKIQELHDLYQKMYDDAVAENERQTAEHEKATVLGRECLALGGFIGR
jgi:threonine dehydratase